MNLTGEKKNTEKKTFQIISICSKNFRERISCLDGAMNVRRTNLTSTPEEGNSRVCRSFSLRYIFSVRETKTEETERRIMGEE